MPERNLILSLLFIWKRTKFTSNARFVETLEAPGLENVLFAFVRAAVDIIQYGETENRLRELADADESDLKQLCRVGYIERKSNL